MSVWALYGKANALFWKSFESKKQVRKKVKNKSFSLDQSHFKPFKCGFFLHKHRHKHIKANVANHAFFRVICLQSRNFFLDKYHV